ncbi:hypothetical protein MKW98_030379, partial [Papaver atlanticum]
MNTTFFSPPAAASLLVGTFLIIIRNYNEDLVGGCYFNTEILLDQRRNESIECVFEGVAHNLGDTYAVLMVDVTGLLYITATDDVNFV